jgi:hypothetical protein
VATVTGYGGDAPVYVLPYDPAQPADEPPPGAERLMWYLAERVALDHVPDAHGVCRAPSCRAGRESFPCVGVRLANVGRLWAALGPWAEYEPGTVVPRTPGSPPHVDGRCLQCPVRRPLTRERADLAAARAPGLFDVYPCPSGLGWHLRVVNNFMQD